MADYFDKHNSSYEGVQLRRKKIRQEITCPDCGYRIISNPVVLRYSEQDDSLIIEGVICKKCRRSIPIKITNNKLRREIIEVRELKEDYFYFVKVKRHEYEFYEKGNRPVPKFVIERCHTKIHKAYREYVTRNRKLKSAIENIENCYKDSIK